MKKLKNNQFVFNQNKLMIKEIENYVRFYKIEDDDDIIDLNNLIRHKKELIKIQKTLTEKLQIQAEEKE